MKRIVLFIVTASLLLCAALTAHADGFSLALPDGAYINSLVPQDENHLLVNTYGVLYCADMTTGMISQLGQDQPFGYVNLLGADGSILYGAGYDYESSAIVFFRASLEDGEWTECARFEPNMEYYGIQRAAFLGGSGYITFATDGRPEQLLRFDPATNETRLCGDFGLQYTTGESLFLMDNSIATVVYDYEKNQNILLCYQPETGKITKEKLNSLLRLENVVFSPSADTFWAKAYDPETDVSGLYAGKTLDALQLIAAPVSAERLCPVGNDCLLAEGQLIYNQQIISQARGNITVYGGFKQYNTQFMLDSGITVTDTYDATLSDILNTKNSDIDVMVFRTNDEMGLKIIKDKGYFTDLSVSAILAQRADRLYPSIASHLRTEDGKLAAWPVYIDPTYCEAWWDPELVEAYDLREPATMLEMLDIIKLLEEEGVFSSDGYLPMDISYDQRTIVDYVLQRFILEQEVQGKRIDFDNAELRALLERIMTEIPKEAVYGECDDGMPLFNLYVGYSCISKDARPHPGIGPSSPVAMETYASVAIVNPYSSHQREAIRYLEFLAQQEQESDYVIYADKTEPLLSPYALRELEKMNKQIEKLQAQEQTMEMREELEALEQTRSSLEAHLCIIDEEDIAAWQKLAPQLVISEQNLYTNELRKLRDRLVDSNLTIDEFIRECNRYMSMVYAEQGM